MSPTSLLIWVFQKHDEANFLILTPPQEGELDQGLKYQGSVFLLVGSGAWKEKGLGGKPTWRHHHRGRQDLNWQHPLRRRFRPSSTARSRDQEGSWYSRVPSPVVQAYHKGCKLPCTFGCAVGDRPGCSGSQCDGRCHGRETRSGHTCASRVLQCCLERRWARGSSGTRVFPTPGTKIRIFLK